MKTQTLALLTACLFAQVVFGHDLYLMPEQFRVPAGQPATIAIHNGDGFPQSQTRPPLQRLRNAQAISAAGTVPLAAPALDGTRAVSNFKAGEGHILVTIEVAENIEGMNGKEFLEYLQEESLQQIIDIRAKAGEGDKETKERYSKYAKTIVLAGAPNGFFNHAAGLPIEFVPEKDPFQTKAGDTLPVRLLFRGKPAAGVQVIGARTTAPGSEIAPLGRTGSDGRIQVPIKEAGMWRLHAIQMERSATPGADWESFWATITFEVK